MNGSNWLSLESEVRTGLAGPFAFLLHRNRVTVVLHLDRSVHDVLQGEPDPAAKKILAGFGEVEARYRCDVLQIGVAGQLLLGRTENNW